MSFRLVPKSVTLDNLELCNDPDFVLFYRISTFQRITASARIELIDQKSTSITHRAVKFARVTKYTRIFSVTYF